ncbi:MAG: metallophosphoesterase [Fimbriimonadaceae bacterium]|nr:metallophosphoesterase [Fimbriimonadaceae bacterium]
MPAKLRPTRRQVLAGALAGAGAVGVAQLWCKDDVRVEHHEVHLPRWDADGFKLVVLGDLHMDDPHRLARGRRAIQLARRAKPQAIAIAGDFLSTPDTAAQDAAFRAIGEEVDGGPPVVAVLGNHDYWLPRPFRIIEGLQGALSGGNRLLRNEVREVDGVTFAGIEDGIAGKDRHDFLRPSHDRNVVAIFHEPDFVSRVDGRIALMVSGHSHGGQVCAPWGTPIKLPYGARTFWRGYYPEAKVPLYVTRGIGTVGPDIRTFSPPEVTVLTLRSS